ncbi:two-component regulator propeller domain-containing protein [Lysobacter silvisoli]|uniref:two-component regulator propeller domain-containing protein n=1 Tax=Lysobacter silvisoli TaxID=2293254 RepID=UPI001313E325|nr:two-component regulator propeller domain-containing protein [Lysobacter silvisoli]
MIIDRFSAESDLVARRVRVAWTLTPAPGETLADAPRQTLRRKTRDFEFPQPPLAPDPYLVYDSAAFPPIPGGGISVIDLPPWEVRDGAERTVHEAVSVAQDVGGEPLERMRRIVATTYGADGQPLRRRIEIVDGGSTPLSLTPGDACYYQLSSPVFDPVEAQRHRAIATPSAPHGLNRSMYDLLPAVHRQFDVNLRPVTPGSNAIPEMAARSGQLRRLLDVYGAAMDSARSSAENLWTLHDVDQVDGRRLPLLADWLGWRLGDADALPLARNELKATPRLYESVGTVTAVGALVTRYTGWTTRTAEFVQHLARSNHAPRYHIHASVPAGAGWRSPLDAAALLGFGGGNDEAFGVGPAPATLVGNVAGPYAIFAGAELSIAVDGGAAFRVRLGSSSFANPNAATAAEVAAAIAAVAGDIVADAVGGQVRLRTRSVGPEAQITVSARESEALTLDAAGADRLTAAADALGRVRVFASDAFGAPDPDQREGERAPYGGLVCKTWDAGQWRGATRLLSTRPADDAAVAHPAACTLADGRVFLARVEAAESADARVRWSLGSSRPRLPAVLQGRQLPRFRLTVGTRLTLRTAGGNNVFQVNAIDYADPLQASTAEVVTAMNAQLTQAVASPAGDGSIRLTSTALGPTARLSVDLALSSCARALGFAHATAPSFGSWDDTLDLSATQTLPALTPGRPTELSALASGEGAILAWSEHQDGRWRLRSSAWLGAVDAIATAAGLALRGENGAINVLDSADGLPSDDIRQALVGGFGTLWVATDAGVARRRGDLTWQSFDSGDGLSSDDCRCLLQTADGAMWVGTAAGLSRIAPNGSISTFDSGDGLADDDVRALALDADGALWIATAGGLSRRDRNGSFANTFAPDLPGDDVRDVVVAADGRVWVATSAGIGERSAAGVWTVLAPPLPIGNDVRGLAQADNALWIAAASGVWRRGSDGAWRGWALADGLPSVDARRVGVDGAGNAWVATAGGAARIARNDSVLAVRSAQGLPSNDVRAWCSPWSGAIALSDGGARGDRDPCLLREASGSILLLWSRWLTGAAGEDRRALRARRYDPVSMNWGAIADVTAPPLAGAADVQPAALALGGGGARVFFSSDRNGGRGLWEVSLNAALVAGAPAALPWDETARIAPLPLLLPVAGLTLLHRCDASLALDQLPPILAGAAPIAAPTRVPEAATLRRHCNTVTPRMADTARNSRHHQWGDLLAYTPHRPLGGDDEPPLSPNEFFTRGTLGLYVTRGRFGQALTATNAARLKQLLAEFLPVNMRAVIVLAPSLTTEVLYPPGADIGESYLDDYPFVEQFLDLADSSAAALPDWVLLLSNQVAGRTADPTNLSTLRRRTYFPPPV